MGSLSKLTLLVLAGRMLNLVQAAAVTTPSFQLGQTFPGISFIDNYNYNNGSTFSPPDPICAVSRTTLVALANDIVEMRTKQGVLLSKIGLIPFFDSLDPQGGGTDPKIVYDEYEDRFVIILLNILSPGKAGQSVENDRRRMQLSTNVTGNSTILMAVSTSGSPAGAKDWHFQAINSLEVNATDSYLADYPGLGVSPDAVYITANLYSTQTTALAGVRLWIVAKSSFYSGGPIAFNKYNPYAGRAPLLSMPTTIHGGPVGNNIGTFLVGYDGYQMPRTVFAVTKVTNPLGTPSFSSFTVDLGSIDYNPAAILLPPAPQLNSTARIDSLDRRILDAKWRNNSLWFTTTVLPKAGPNFNQTTAYWIKVSTNTFTVEDLGEIGGEDIANGTFTSFASVDVNTQGAAAFGFAASGPLIYPGAYVVGRNPSDPLGTVSPSFVVHQGIDYYLRTNGGARNRWGDYSGIAVDPTDDSFWVFNQYAAKRGFTNGLKEDGVWSTVWARFISTSTLKTLSPTSIPTASPTRSSTSSPSSGPTLLPTLLPTSSPTSLPTSSPTSVPTSLPASPTPLPTFLPTLQPTTSAPAVSKRPTVVIKVPPGYCFSEANSVEVEGRGLIKMNDLRIGDKVKDAHGNIVRVYSFGHFQQHVKATYLQIHLHGLERPLEISHDHMLFVKGTAVPASSVVPGDELDLVPQNSTGAKVVSIKVVVRNGAYAPFTTSGTIMVSGVAASSYVTLQKESHLLVLGHWQTPLSMHWLAHVFQSPHRIYCSLMGFDFCRETESYNRDGLSNRVEFPFHMFSWLIKQRGLVVAVAFVPIFIVGLALFAIERGWMYLIILLLTIRILQQNHLKKTV